MRRLKIMSDDVPMACGDVFGINDMLDRLEEFCREQGLEMDTFAYAMEQMKYIGEIVYLEDGGK